MRTHIVLIDYENLQPNSLELLVADHFRVLIFVGASQTKLPYDFVAPMQKLGTRAEYIKIAGNGSNAIDFHIAFYIGVLSASNPGAYFYIVSMDAGFDPLIQHLKSRNIVAGRVKAIREIPVLKLATSKLLEGQVQLVASSATQLNATKPLILKAPASSEERIQVVATRRESTEVAKDQQVTTFGSLGEKLRIVLGWISKNKSRPGKLKALRNSIASHFGKKLCKAEILAIIDVMKERGFIVITNTRVTYPLMEQESQPVIIEAIPVENPPAPPKKRRKTLFDDDDLD